MATQATTVPFSIATMTTRLTGNVAILAVAAGAGACGWSGASQACSMDAYVSEICAMAITYPPRGYLPADGRTVPLQANVALYALTGLTYGGDLSKNTFQLPDLRGRFILGAGQRTDPSTSQAVGANYPIGQGSGNATMIVATRNLPPLSAQASVAVTAPAGVALVDLGNVTDGASTVDMSATTFTAPGATLVLKGADAAGAVGTAQGNAFGTANTPNLKLYAGATPNVTMRAGTIAGTLAGAIPGATAQMALKGSLSVPAQQRQAAYSYNGMFTNPNQPAGAMPPYQAINYYIAVQGYFPPRP